MYTKEKLLEMLTSQKASARYEACEWIRIGYDSSPEIIRALQRATYDQDQEVAERAKHALEADIHHKMAIKMGLIAPDKLFEAVNRDHIFTIDGKENRRINPSQRSEHSFMLQPHTHADLLSAYRILCVPISLCFICNAFSSNNFMPVIVMVIVIGIISIIIWSLPVRCTNPDCNSRMEIDQRRINYFTVNILYKCPKCNNLEIATAIELPPADPLP